MAKSRKNKKYRPKSDLMPSFFYKFSQVTDAELVNMALAARLSLEALASDDPKVDDTIEIEGAVHHGYVLAAAFENKSELQLMFLMASGAMIGARNEIRDGKKVPECVIELASTALSVAEDMRKQCDRAELCESLRVTARGAVQKLRIADGAMWKLNKEVSRRAVKLIEGKRGAAFINGKLRLGFVRYNPTMKRIEWFDPNDETTVPILKETLVLLEEPINLEE